MYLRTWFRLGFNGRREDHRSRTLELRAFGSPISPPHHLQVGNWAMERVSRSVSFVFDRSTSPWVSVHECVCLCLPVVCTGGVWSLCHVTNQSNLRRVKWWRVVLSQIVDQEFRQGAKRPACLCFTMHGETHLGRLKWLVGT